jgi:hypothetical protein
MRLSSRRLALAGLISLALATNACQSTQPRTHSYEPEKPVQTQPTPQSTEEFAARWEEARDPKTKKQVVASMGLYFNGYKNGASIVGALDSSRIEGNGENGYFITQPLFTTLATIPNTLNDPNYPIPPIKVFYTKEAKDLLEENIAFRVAMGRHHFSHKLEWLVVPEDLEAAVKNQDAYNLLKRYPSNSTYKLELPIIRQTTPDH